LADSDVFRSQFRATRNAPVSPIEIVNWGLEHIDRIRKGRIASREATAQSWQMWLVFWVGVANIVVSIAVPLLKHGDAKDTNVSATHVQPRVAECEPQAKHP